jgi:hypothetical protein
VAVRDRSLPACVRSYPLSGRGDAAGQTWREVPGYGLVNWTVEQITGQACYLVSLHRRGQATMRVRFAWGWVPLVVWPRRYCKVCQITWLCRTGAWAQWWLDAIAAPERDGAEPAP